MASLGATAYSQTVMGHLKDDTLRQTQITT